MKVLILTFLFLITWGVVTQDIKIIPYQLNPGLFLEKLHSIHLLDQNVKVTTLIEINQITEVIKRVTDEAVYVWDNLGNSFQNFTKDFK